jgi:hypothetical protein
MEKRYLLFIYLPELPEFASDRENQTATIIKKTITKTLLM